MQQYVAPKISVEKYHGRRNRIETGCLVSSAFDPIQTPKDSLPKHIQCSAIWDTGATGTSISPRVVDQLGLVQTTIKQIYTAQNHTEKSVPILAPCFLINIILPCNVGVKALEVSALNFDTKADVLIGMDLISLGTFIIMNNNGNTEFMFTLPSITDFNVLSKSINNLNNQIDPFFGIKVGRNDPCPCGSGKKYKKCHGAMSV